MPVSPVHRQTRASCTAWRSAEELCGGAGTSSLGVSFESDEATVRPVRAVASLRGIFSTFLLSLAVLSAGGCGVTGSAAEADEGLRFEDSAPSLEVLGSEVLQAFTRRDTASLDRFRLTEYEHNEVVWPELPASAPEVNFPIDYAWTNIQNRNRRALSRQFERFTDRRPGFQRVECRGATEAFETFQVLTDCWIVFSVEDRPELFEVQLFKDVLVRGGGMKIFRYYDEEPRPYRGDGAE